MDPNLLHVILVVGTTVVTILFGLNVFFIKRLVAKIDRVDDIDGKLDVVIVCLKNRGLWIDPDN